MTSLLVARGASLGTPGAVLQRGLDFETTGARLYVCGDAGPLVSALLRIPEDASFSSMLASLGEMRPVREAPTVVAGSIDVAGQPVASPGHLQQVGGAPLDLPRPAKATVGSVLEAELRLKLALRREKRSAADVTAQVDDVMRRAGVIAKKDRAVKLLSLPERRVLAIATAMVSHPAVIVAEAPLSNLEGQGAEYVRGALEAAAHLGQLIVSGGLLTPESPEGAFARTCSDLLLLGRDEVVTFGRPLEVLGRSRVYRVQVRTRGEELRALLVEKGAHVSGGASHFTVSLPDDARAGADATFVLTAAHEARSAVALVLPLM